MLFVIRTNAAVIRTTVVGSRMWFLRIFRSFVVVPDLLVIVYIVGDKHLLKAVLRTSFCHEHLRILEYDFGVDLSMTNRAETLGKVVIDIATRVAHKRGEWGWKR